MANSWFRMYAEFATDPKVQMMSEVMQRRLVMLFCLRCSDVTVTLSDDELAFQLRISDEELAETKALFIRKKFIDSKWNLINWNKRQFASDSSAARTKAYRERLKSVTVTGDVTSHVTNSDALDTDTDTDKSLSTPNGVEVETNRSDLPHPAKTDFQEGAKDAAHPDRARIPVRQIVELYHSQLPMLPKVEKLTKARIGHIQQRWREDLPSLDAWKNYLTDVSKSNFLTGKVPGKEGKPPFRATLEWLCLPGNFAKVSEGQYHR